MESRRERAKAIGAQAARFLTVGVLSFAVDLGALRALVAAGTDLVLATALAWLAGFIVNFALNRAWSFKDRSAWTASGARFAALAALNAAATTASVPLLVHAGLDLVLAKSIVVVVLFGVNFAVTRAWVFRGALANQAPSPSSSGES